MTEIAPMPMPGVPPRTVLVVDDEEHVRNALARMLTEAGCTVLAAESGEEASEILHQHRVQLLIGTLHTNTAPSTVDRIIDQFPADRSRRSA